MGVLPFLRKFCGFSLVAKSGKMVYDREKGRKGRGGMKRTDEQLQELLLRELSKAGRLRRKQLIEAGIVGSVWY